MENILFSILRSSIAYLLLLFVARLMGRKALSQMTYFDFAVIIALGSVAADLSLGKESTPASDAAVLLTLGGLAVLTGVLHVKSVRFRKLVNSEPVVAIEDGQIVNQNLMKCRLSVDELTSLLRVKGFFQYADVEYAVVESYGQLSVLPRSQKAPLTPSDLGIPTGLKGLTKDLVMDGKILEENLRSIPRDEAWLMGRLAEQGATSVDQVFYAGLDAQGTLYVSMRRGGDGERHGQYGIE